MMFSYSEITSIVSCVIAACAVCVSVYAVRQSKRAELNATYFSQITAAYSAFLGSISKYVLMHEKLQVEQMAACLYQMKLFATDEIMDQAQTLYEELVQWKPSDTFGRFPYDLQIHMLSEAMRRHLDLFRSRTETP